MTYEMTPEDEEVQQFVNDCLGILDRSDLNWYEGIGAVCLLHKILVDAIELEGRHA